jgi:diketogulonate reductase-like aldo/keto reductase
MSAALHKVFRGAGRRPADTAAPGLDSRKVLPSGNAMPLLGLGTAGLTRHTAESVRQAVAAGFRLIDTSHDYHTQRGIGEALRACGVTRDALYVVTKVAPDEDSFEALRRNLRELRLDHVDLALMQAPLDHGLGDAAWRGLRRAKREGLTVDIGVSNYSIDHIEELVYRSGEMPVVNQVEWTPFGHSPRMLDFCRDNGIVIQAGSPLTRATRLNDDQLASMAARYGRTPAQMVLRWNLQLGVVPLPKANTPQHQADNLHVFDFEIVAHDMVRLNALNQHYSVHGQLAYL